MHMFFMYLVYREYQFHTAPEVFLDTHYCLHIIMAGLLLKKGIYVQGKPSKLFQAGWPSLMPCMLCEGLELHTLQTTQAYLGKNPTA